MNEKNEKNDSPERDKQADPDATLPRGCWIALTVVATFMLILTLIAALVILIALLMVVNDPPFVHNPSLLCYMEVIL